MLQEFYVRDLVKEKNDSILFVIDFNSSADDCGAPNCYSTETSFGFTRGENIKFPESISIRLNTAGECIPNGEGEDIKNVYSKINENDSTVNYYHSESKSGFQLQFNKRKAEAYLFENVDKDFHTKEHNPDEVSIYSSTQLVKPYQELFDK